MQILYNLLFHENTVKHRTFKKISNDMQGYVIKTYNCPAKRYCQTINLKNNLYLYD